MSLEVGRSPFVLKKIINIFLILAFATICWGCGTSEEKKAKHLSNAHKYEKSQEYKKAAIEFKNVIQIDPKQDKVRLALGRLFFMDGNTKRPMHIIIEAWPYWIRKRGYWPGKILLGRLN